MDVIDKIDKLEIAGLDTRKEYKRFYPQGEVMTHVVGFTNVEDVGQESMELAQQKTLVGATGSRRVIKDRLGRIVEDVGLSQAAARRQGPDPVGRQQAAVHRVHAASRKRSRSSTPRPARAVVLDVQTGEVLALANWPTYNPNDRRVLTGEQLRNRVMTDTFEPGSTLKPFTVALALDTKRVTPGHRCTTPRRGRMVIGDRTHPRHRTRTAC